MKKTLEESTLYGNYDKIANSKCAGASDLLVNISWSLHSSAADHVYQMCNQKVGADHTHD